MLTLRACTMPCFTALATALLLVDSRCRAALQDKASSACGRAGTAAARGLECSAERPAQGAPVQLMSPGATHDSAMGNVSVKVILDLVPPCLPVFALVNADVELVKRALRDPAYPMDPSLPLVHINVLYVDTGSERMLFDAGAGAAAGGALANRLREDGIAPDSITRVFLSHAHWDHIDGLFDGPALAFPHATVHMSSAEWQYWRADAVDPLTARVTPWVFDALVSGAKQSLARVRPASLPVSALLKRSGCMHKSASCANTHLQATTRTPPPTRADARL